MKEIMKIRTELMKIAKELSLKDKKLAFQIRQVCNDLEPFSGSEAHLYKQEQKK